MRENDIIVFEGNKKSPNININWPWASNQASDNINL